MIVVCRVCHERKERVRPQQNLCRDCYNAQMRAYNADPKNRDRILASKRAWGAAQRRDPAWVEQRRLEGRAYWQQRRHEAIMAYGGYRCVCCGETEPKFLTIDHVNNDGAEHRRELGYHDGNGKGGSSRTLKWLKDNGYPEGFQVLCMNCNMGKQRNGGTCPHQANLLRKTA